MCDGKWEARRQQIGQDGHNQVITVDEGSCQQAISLALPDGDMHQTQFLLLHNWHAQAHTHALQKVPQILVLSYARYGALPGRVQKNSCNIVWRPIVYVPVFSGDNDLSSGVAEYAVVATIMHHGEEVSLGHYTAQLVEADGEVLCDDNVAPTYQARDLRNEADQANQSRNVCILVCKLRSGMPLGRGVAAQL